MEAAKCDIEYLVTTLRLALCLPFTHRCRLPLLEPYQLKVSLSVPTAAHMSVIHIKNTISLLMMCIAIIISLAMHGKVCIAKLSALKHKHGTIFATAGEVLHHNMNMREVWCQDGNK